MTMVNQAGDEIREEVIRWPDQLPDHKVQEVLLLVIDHLKQDLIWTNATKHGTWEYKLRPEE